MPLHLGSFGYGVLVTPDEVLRALAPGLGRPVRRDTLVWALGCMVALFEHIHTDVLFEKVVDGQVSGLVQEFDPFAICDGLTVEHHPYPPRGILEIKGVRPEHPCVEVEGAVALLAERSGPNS